MKNVNGYINSLSEFAVIWDGFDDNIDASALGYTNKIKAYSVEIGMYTYIELISSLYFSRKYRKANTALVRTRFNSSLRLRGSSLRMVLLSAAV